jgi:hypothetical protein
MGAQRKPQRARPARRGAARRQHAVERSGAKPLGAESARRGCTNQPARRWERSESRRGGPPGAAQLGARPQWSEAERRRWERSPPGASPRADGAQRKPQRAPPGSQARSGPQRSESRWERGPPGAAAPRQERHSIAWRSLQERAAALRSAPEASHHEHARAAPPRLPPVRCARRRSAGLNGSGSEASQSGRHRWRRQQRQPYRCTRRRP